MEDLRLKALDIAAQSAGPEPLLERAEAIYQWLRYGKDGATDVRRALAGEKIETPKATIHRHPPIDDYKSE